MHSRCRCTVRWRRQRRASRNPLNQLNHSNDLLNHHQQFELTFELKTVGTPPLKGEIAHPHNMLQASI